MLTICAKCNRTLARPPILIGGEPYGPTCAKSVKPTPDPLASDLFNGIDLDGAVLRARRRVGRVIDVAVRREVLAMRASWRAAA